MAFRTSSGVPVAHWLDYNNHNKKRVFTQFLFLWFKSKNKSVIVIKILVIEKYSVGWLDGWMDGCKSFLKDFFLHLKMSHFFFFIIIPCVPRIQAIGSCHHCLDQTLKTEEAEPMSPGLLRHKYFIIRQVHFKRLI